MKPEHFQPAPEFFRQLGPLESLLDDSAITEIMVNHPKQIFVERHGQLEETGLEFDSEEHLLQVIQRIAEPLGRVLNESNPILDLRLPDGSRVNVVGRPIALNGPVLTIRKFSKQPLTKDDLILYESWDEAIMRFLQMCVLSRLNIVLAGGSGAGKTTVLNILCEFIPDNERIVTVERASELMLRQKHVVALETRPANLEGKGEVSMDDLVVNALKMRPDRIIIGEVHGGEVLHIFQAMNTGHDGAMFSIHANNARDVLARLEVMATMSGWDIPILTIREQMTAALDIIVNQQRLRDGSRRIMSISEVVGLKNGVPELQDIFLFEQSDVREGRIVGHFTPTGITPHCLPRLQDNGFSVAADFFAPR